MFTLLFSVTSGAAELRCERLFSAPNAVFDTLAATGGRITVVYDRNDIPNGLSLKEAEFLTGAKIYLIDPQNIPQRPEKIKGVVLHLGDADFLKQFVVGDLDLLTGWRNLNEKFDDKFFEYQWAIQYDPQIMAPTVSFAAMKARIVEDNLYQSVTELRKKMIWSSDFRFSKEEREILVRYLEKVISVVQMFFPEGAVVKHVREFQTGDTSGGVINTNKLDSRQLVDGFIKNFYKLRTNKFRDGKRKRLSHKDFEENDLAATFDKRWTLVQTLVFGEFEELMAQKLLKIKREIRLDVARGSVVNVIDRFDQTWATTELFARAKKFVNDFFKKVPHPYNRLSGGVDAALLEDDELVVVDWNIGAASGFIDGLESPVTANMYISSLLEKRSPFLVELSKAQSEKDILNFINKHLKFMSEGDKKYVRQHMVRWLRHEGIINDEQEAALLPH